MGEESIENNMLFPLRVPGSSLKALEKQLML